jgi:gamma-glutamylcyclotransferase
MACDTWYFAYGSNLDPSRKKQRTGKIREAIRCRLLGWRFAFNKRCDDGSVYANIVPDANKEVWGVIYRCTPQALAQMDVFEGVRTGHYSRCAIKVVIDEGNEVEAVAYVAKPAFVQCDGVPTQDYLACILAGARYHNLPEEYVSWIESTGTQPRTETAP